MRYKRKEICKLDRGQRSAVLCGEKTVGSHLVSILSSHTWGSRWTRKPHRTLHPITASGTNRALLTLQGTREGCRLTLKHLHKTPGYPSPLSSQLTAPAPCSPGRLSLPLLQGDPVGLDALGDQWGPLILLHLAPRGSPERERWSQTLREGDPRTPDHGSQKNSKLDVSWLIPNPLCPARGSCHILPSILLHTSVPFPGSYPQPPRGPRLTAGPGGPAGPSFPFKPGPPCEPDLGQQVRWEGEASQAGDPKKMCWKV